MEGHVILKSAMYLRTKQLHIKIKIQIQNSLLSLITHR